MICSNVPSAQADSPSEDKSGRYDGGEDHMPGLHVIPIPETDGGRLLGELNLRLAWRGKRGRQDQSLSPAYEEAYLLMRIVRPDWCESSLWRNSQLVEGQEALPAPGSA